MSYYVENFNIPNPSGKMTTLLCISLKNQLISRRFSEMVIGFFSFFARKDRYYCLHTSGRREDENTVSLVMRRDQKPIGTYTIR